MTDKTNERLTPLEAFRGLIARLGDVPVCPVCAVSPWKTPKDHGPERWAVRFSPGQPLIGSIFAIGAEGLTESNILAICTLCGFTATFTTAPVRFEKPTPETMARYLYPEIRERASKDLGRVFPASWDDLSDGDKAMFVEGARIRLAAEGLK